MSPFQRTGHAIKPNHSGALPRYIISIKVEYDKRQTDKAARRFNHVFKSVSCVSGRLARGRIVCRKVVSFGNVDDFWSFVYSQTRSNYTVWIVSHNILSGLILCGLPHRFQCGELSIDRPRSRRTVTNETPSDKQNQALAVLEEPPTIIGCRVGSTQGRIVLVDSRNWFPDRVPTDLSTKESGTVTQNPMVDSDNSQRQSSERQAVGLLTVFEKLIKWVSENDMGMFRYTLSGQAMGAYRHRFMQQRIYIHDNLDVQRLERKGYYGGRSEVYKCGPINETVYQLDVNALFPSVMATQHFPYFLTRYEQRAELMELLPSIDWSASVADVEIHTNKPLYPLRTDTHVIFPIGTFRTALSGNELFAAFKDGSLRKCGTWAEYKLAPLFEVWVSTLWDMRQQCKRSGDVLYEHFTKRVMNSLYGKFAQLTPNWENVAGDYTMLPFTTESRLDWTTNEWTTLRSVGWQIQKKCKREERKGSFYAIAGFVTAAARQRMDWLRRVAGKTHVYYQGVDSLICSKRGYDNLCTAGEVNESELGKLRLEHQSDYGMIRGISDYQIGSKVVLSSRALNSEVSDIGDVLQHRYYVMEHLFRNGPIDHIEEKVEEWHRTNSYKKGQIKPDGWVSPLELGATPMSANDGVSSVDAAAVANCSNSG